MEKTKGEPKGAFEISYEREQAARILGIVEDYLMEKGVEIPNDERAESGDENAAILYGEDYYRLEDDITALLTDGYEGVVASCPNCHAGILPSGVGKPCVDCGAETAGQ